MERPESAARDTELAIVPLPCRDAVMRPVRVVFRDGVAASLDTEEARPDSLVSSVGAARAVLDADDLAESAVFNDG